MIEEVARAVLDRIPLTMPLRRHVRGRLTQGAAPAPGRRGRRSSAPGSRRRTRGASSPSDPSPDAIRLPEPDDRPTRRSCARRSSQGSSRRRASELDAGDGGRRAASRSPASTSPSGEQLPDERWRVGGDRGRAATRPSKGVARDAVRRARLELAVGAATHPLLHPGQGRGDRRGLARRAAPDAARGRVGRVRARPRRRCSPRCPSASSTRTSSRIPAVLPGHRGRGRRGRRGRGARRCGARGRRATLLREARVFDIYRGEQVGEGRKSVAIHLAFQSPERTLTEEEATAARERIVAALAERFRRRAPRMSNPIGDDGVEKSVTRLAAVVAALVVAASLAGGASGAAPGQNTKLSATVGPGFTIILRRGLRRSRHEARSRHVRHRGGGSVGPSTTSISRGRG